MIIIAGYSSKEHTFSPPCLDLDALEFCATDRKRFGTRDAICAGESCNKERTTKADETQVEWNDLPTGCGSALANMQKPPLYKEKNRHVKR